MRRVVIWVLFLSSIAQAACQLGTPFMSTSPDNYDYQAELVQAFTVPVQCDAGEHPVLTFDSSDGTLDTVHHRYSGRLIAANGDRLQYYIPDVGTPLAPGQTSFRFQVVFPAFQWGASTEYNNSLTVSVTF